jgi:Xaa-Pro aminopeptidase
MSFSEMVGQAYDRETQLSVQKLTWHALHSIAGQIRPGMMESEAQAIGEHVLQDLKMELAWHPLLIRFGKNTLRTFKQKSKEDLRLTEDDIFFIDMGPVWSGHEGDAGATFTVGNDSEKIDCALAAKTLFDYVEAHWRHTGATGKELYDVSEYEANKMGFRLNLDIRGHRVGDYPHAVHKPGKLAELDSHPKDALWILEIQLAHSKLEFGAFYEDLLVQYDS